MEYDLTRKKLIEIIEQGLLLKAIAVNVGIAESDLSRFKNGMNCLKESEENVLFHYLNKVVIPQRVFASQEKVKHNRGQVSLDLLRELD